jgi:hypothetical protein
MSEISRRLRARDIRISHGHLWAGVAGGGIALALAFLVGAGFGRRAEASERAAEEVAGPDLELVDLLARIEASTNGGSARLTYPQALAGAPTDVALPAEPQLPGRVSVGAPARVELPGLGAPPTTGVGASVARTVHREVAAEQLERLVQAGLPVWGSVERSGGVDVFVVGVGPFGSLEAAQRAAVGVAELPTDLEWRRFGSVAPVVVSPPEEAAPPEGTAEAP